MGFALDALKNKTMGVNQAAKTFGVPKSTVLRRFKNQNKHFNAAKKSLGRPSDLPKHIEDELAQHCLKLESMFYGLTPVNVRKLACEIADINNVPTRFNYEKKMAENARLSGFLERHPELSIRAPEPTSLARASGFNKNQVKQFFSILEKISEENDIGPNKILNMDESGLTVVQKVSKIVGQKGKHQIGSITSMERGRNVTIICCVSASGQYVPPGIIFPRKRMKPELQDGAPSNSVFFCQVSLRAG